MERENDYQVVKLETGEVVFSNDSYWKCLGYIQNRVTTSYSLQGEYEIRTGLAPEDQHQTIRTSPIKRRK